MTRSSALRQLYENQSKSMSDQPVKKNETQNGKYRYYFIGMLIGILTGGIPLSVLATIYAKQSTSTIVSTTTTASLLVLRWNPVGITVAGVENVSGTASNLLNVPYDAVPDGSDNLYIADRNNNRTQKFLVGSSTGSTVAGLANGTTGLAASELALPYSLVVNSDSSIYVVDSVNNRIQFWANNAVTGVTVAGSTTGTAGNTNSLLNYPCGMARDPNTGTIYIADNKNHRIMAYASGASSGSLVAGGNGPGTGRNQLSQPYGIYFDSFTNSLAISNSNIHTVVRWVLGATNWTLLAGNANGTAGATPTLLNGPKGITFDSMGNMYVADTNNQRIQLLMSGQTTGITIAGSVGLNGSNATLFNRPYSVKLDNQLNIYVADTYNHRVQKFLLISSM